MRNARQDRPDRLGKWEAVSRGGWVVVCPTRIEALSLLIFVGSRTYGVPRNVTADDPRYAEWLQHPDRMRIERYRATGKGEVLFLDFMNGWCPSTAERLQGRANHLLVEDDDYIRVMRPSPWQPMIGGALRQALTQTP